MERSEGGVAGAVTQPRPRRALGSLPPRSRARSTAAAPRAAPSARTGGACESRADASAGILDLVERITAGIVGGRIPAASARSGMEALQTASKRLDGNDVAGACVLLSDVRKRYRLSAAR